MMPQQAHDMIAGEQQRQQRQFRIKRGALAIGTDGTLGTIEQIVVDSASAELRALIIRTSHTGELIELPATHILHDRSDGEGVYLDIGNADLASHPALARPYQREQYVPVGQDEAALQLPSEPPAQAAEHPIVTVVEADAAQLVLPAKEAREAKEDAMTPATETAHQDEGIHGEQEQQNRKETEAYKADDGDDGEDDEGLTPTLPMRAIRRPPRLVEESPMSAASDVSDMSGMNGALDNVPIGHANDTIMGGVNGVNGAANDTEEIEMTKEQEMREQMHSRPTDMTSATDVTSEIDEREAWQLREHEGGGAERQVQLPAMTGLTMLGAGVGVLVGAVVLLAQRRRANQLTRLDAQALAGQARETLATVGQNAGQLAESARDTLEQTRRRARRAARRTRRRIRWFRNGLIAGAILAVLFAPMPGEQLRDRIAAMTEQIRSKIAK